MFGAEGVSLENIIQLLKSVRHKTATHYKMFAKMRIVSGWLFSFPWGALSIVDDSDTQINMVTHNVCEVRAHKIIKKTRISLFCRCIML